MTVRELLAHGDRVELEDVSLTLERFECVPAAADCSLVRIEGSWDPREPAVAAPVLVVSDSGVVHRQAALAESEQGRFERGWHAAFAVPNRWLEVRRASWALELGAATVALPNPVERECRGGGPQGSAEAPTPATRTPGRPRARLAAFLLALGAAALAVALALAGGISPDRGSSSPSAEEARGVPQGPADTGGAVPLRAPAPTDPFARGRATGTAGAAARGRVVRTGERGLTLELAGLAPGRRYDVWLYGNIIDAVRLGSLRGPSGTLRLRLPLGPTARPYLDVSDQMGAGGSHSGRSVLRMPTSALAGG